MEIQEFIKNFAEQFDETELEVFNADTRFRDLEEWNSFLALSVMAMVKSEYDVALTASEMRDSSTIQDLFDIINLRA